MSNKENPGNPELPGNPEDLGNNKESGSAGNPHSAGKPENPGNPGNPANEENPGNDESPGFFFEWEAPADRFLTAQMWWTASELARRHSYLQISMFEHATRGRLMLVHGERAGVSIEFDFVHGVKCVVQGEVSWITWLDVFSANEENEIVERIEDAMRVETPTLSPHTTPRVLTYRVIASALTTAVDDEHGWDAVPAPIAIGGDPANPSCEYFRGFPTTAASIAAYTRSAIDEADPVTGSVFHQPFWALLRGLEPIAIFDTAGDIHTVMGVTSLIKLYDHINRNLSLTTASVLGPYLP